jgi:hypothetical protein
MKDRAERREQVKRVIKKRLKIIKRISPDYKEVIEQPHRMAKKHPLDCGNPMCGLCHGDKNMKKIKISVLRKITDLKSEIAELERGIK